MLCRHEGSSMLCELLRCLACYLCFYNTSSTVWCVLCAKLVFTLLGAVPARTMLHILRIHTLREIFLPRMHEVLLVLSADCSGCASAELVWWHMRCGSSGG
jgi:ribosomal protein S27E